MKKKKESSKKPKWDAAFDKRIAKIKEEALENDNHFVFILTSKDVSDGERVQGACSSRNFNVMRAAEMFFESIPEEIMEKIVMKRMLMNILPTNKKKNK